MRNRITLSGQHQDINSIEEHFIDAKNSILYYFSKMLLYDPLFIGLSPTEFDQVIKERIDELGTLSTFSILAAIEARFRIDFDYRIKNRLKDRLSREFIIIQRTKGKNIRFDDELLDYWKTYGNVSKMLISELKGAFKYRHWLAHGRYWMPKLGRMYDFDDIYSLASTALNTIPLKK